MQGGTLRLEVSNLTGAPVAGLRFSFRPLDAGGAPMSAKGEGLAVVINGIACHGGAGTLYQVRVSAGNYRPYSFFQRMVAGAKNAPSDGRILLVTDVRKVRGISAPSFATLSAAARRMLREASFYDSLPPMEKACALNVAAKSAHGSSDRCLRHVGQILRVEQDRCFCVVDSAMPAFLQRSGRFKTVNGSLHKPLPGYVRQESYKTLDAHANLQVTLMRKPDTDSWAADIDIDEAAGIQHGFEVIRNKLTGNRTNPYLIRELLLLADWQERTLDPGYEFIF